MPAPLADLERTLPAELYHRKLWADVAALLKQAQDQPANK
jgi:hypothetical protein